MILPQLGLVPPLLVSDVQGHSLDEGADVQPQPQEARIALTEYNLAT